MSDPNATLCPFQVAADQGVIADGFPGWLERTWHVALRTEAFDAHRASRYWEQVNILLIGATNVMADPYVALELAELASLALVHSETCYLLPGLEDDA